MTSASARRLFLDQYGRIRAAEGRGSNDADYFRSLPFVAANAPHAEQWAIRARSFRYFVKNILPSAPCRILDLGAGNGWLSHRLAELGHAPVALDIFRDGRDGLDAARHYLSRFPVVEAEFDAIPVNSGNFDLAVFNASFHYSPDYARTLSEVRRVLRPGGRVVILDTPVYKLPEHGLRMRAERQQLFERQFGFRSEALDSIEFMDEPMLTSLASSLRITWKIHRPWYGLAWHVRPLVAKMRKQRPPSRFWILEGTFAA
ncbi:MAG: class I SAM-dependent methyltransferase [Acidobacteriota bacterium]